ncbi:MAG: rhodanese-like domain-containing protein [Flavobacteriales bacterium]|nr:rhodanese-like domain-containing protein [Flavobacteriales bacterium]
MQKILKYSLLFFAIGIGITFLCAFIFNPEQAQGFRDMVNAKLKHHIPTIETKDLEPLLKSKKIQLLDTREPEECMVSYIDGAVMVGYNHFSSYMLSGLDKNKPVVVYCSVGVRSEKIGEKLVKLGFKDVRNLFGGIFAWSMENRPLTNSKGKTDKVHPYSSKWSKWLPQEKISYE